MAVVAALVLGAMNMIRDYGEAMKHYGNTERFLVEGEGRDHPVTKEAR